MKQNAWKSGALGLMLFLSPALKIFFNFELVESWGMYSHPIPICYANVFEDKAGDKAFEQPTTRMQWLARIHPSSVTRDVEGFMTSYCARRSSDSSIPSPTTLYFDVYCSISGTEDERHWTRSLNKGMFTCLTSADSANAQL